MPASPIEFTIASHFADKSPTVREVYDRILKSLRKLGPVTEEPKKTSIHLVRVSAFAGVSTRKEALWLNIRLDHKLDSPRVHKVEQVSARRFHNELKLSMPEQVDTEIIGWLKDAYSLE